MGCAACPLSFEQAKQVITAHALALPTPLFLYWALHSVHEPDE